MEKTIENSSSKKMLSKEQLERDAAKICELWKNLQTLDERDGNKVYFHELWKKQASEYFEKLNLKKKLLKRQYNREYWKNLTPEKKQRHNEQAYKYWKKLSPKKREELKLKRREWWKIISPEKREEMIQRKHEKNLVKEEIERKKEELKHFGSYCSKKSKTEEQMKQIEERNCKYYKNLSPEQKEESRPYLLKNKKKKRVQKTDNRKQTTCDDVSKSARKEQNLGYCEENVRRSARFIVQELNIDTKPKEENFCYECRVQFSNNSDLLEHIVRHLTMPLVILSRIDQQIIKIESKYLQTNSDTSQNVICIKTECIKSECDEEIEPELNNTHVDIHTAIDIEIDEPSFYICKKEEI